MLWSEVPSTFPSKLRAVFSPRLETHHAFTTKLITAKYSSVRHHLAQSPHIGLAHQRQLLQLAHTAGLFRSQQMAFAGVHALDLAGAGELETLPRSAVRFQFLLRIRRIPWHSVTSSRSFLNVGLWFKTTRRDLRYPPLAPPASPPPRPSWELTMPPTHCLPCAPAFQSNNSLQFHPTAATSWRGPLPGAPFRGHDEKSSRELCALRPEIA